MDSAFENKKIKNSHRNKVSRKDAEKAVEVLIKWAGDDPNREGLKDTPKRVINAFEEFFSGYNESADEVLSKPLMMWLVTKTLLCLKILVLILIVSITWFQ